MLPNSAFLTVKEKYDKQFLVEVSLNGCVVGRGQGTSKKRAEQDAARAALETLFPNEM